MQTLDGSSTCQLQSSRDAADCGTSLAVLGTIAAPTLTGVQFTSALSVKGCDWSLLNQCCSVALSAALQQVVRRLMHVCRAVMVQLGFFFHMKQALGYPAVITRPLLFAMGFMLFFSIVIALFKDIPDVRGDSRVSPFVSSFQPLQLLMLRACKASSSSTRPFRAISFG